MSKLYMDFDLIKKYPNKYNLTPKNIKALKVLDWERLKKHTWYKSIMSFMSFGLDLMKNIIE